MAYCIFDVLTSNNFTIVDWNIINLTDDERIETPPKKCCYKNKNCKKTATHHRKGEDFFCKRHAQEISNNHHQYILPEVGENLTNLTKHSLVKLDEYIKKYDIFPEGTEIPKLKKDKIVKMEEFFCERIIESIPKKKTKNANDTELISIGKNIKKNLDELSHINSITNVIIENQISPIATRMKTIQGMLAQYFIMKNNDISIEFISSFNKLKVVPPLLENTLIPTSSIPTQTKNQHYKENKKRGIELCNIFLEQTHSFEEWKILFNSSKKKDDLSDCFLQGVWYIQK
jgi:hypothetical protein